MQNKAVNQSVANNSNYTFDRRAIQALAAQISKFTSDLDAGRSTHELEIDGYGITFDFSADLVCYIGGEPDERLCYPANERINVTRLWSMDDWDGNDLEIEKLYLNHLLN